MDWLQTITLALVQGISEFLPVSSSAHLILVSDIAGWPDQGVLFDAALHGGTLAASLCYFRRPIFEMLASLSPKSSDLKSRRLAFGLILATVPVLIFGGLFHRAIDSELRSLATIAASTFVFAILLGAASFASRRFRRTEELGYFDFLLLGLAQALALIPGASRAGVMLTAALFLGCRYRDAAWLSIVTGLPTLTAATLFSFAQLGEGGSSALTPALAGALIAAVAAFFCIHALLSLIERIGVAPFVIYRILLSLALFSFVLG